MAKNVGDKLIFIDSETEVELTAHEMLREIGSGKKTTMTYAEVLGVEISIFTHGNEEDVGICGGVLNCAHVYLRVSAYTHAGKEREVCLPVSDRYNLCLTK